MAYRPQVDEMIEAIDENNSRPARDCPCKVTAVTSSAISAVDKNSNERIFKYDTWRFRKINSK